MLKTFNITRYTNWLIPPKLRQNNIVAFVQALVTPLKVLYNSFTRHVADIDYSLGITSQVVYLEKALNDAFDNDLRRIEIVDGYYLDPVLLWHYNDQAALDESEKVTIAGYGDEDNSDIYGYSMYSSQAATFIVNVPAAIVTEAINARIVAMVEKYRLASKNYSINLV